MNTNRTLGIKDAHDSAAVEKLLLLEQKRVDYDTREFTVELLVHKLESEELVVPTYQRVFQWDKRRQSRLIESFMIGLPVPFLFAADLPESGQLEIIDGVQRLYTLKSFFSQELVLQDLEKLAFVNGFRYRDLPISQQRRFKNRTLRMIVISENADQDVRFDIFERINSGSLILAPAEMRGGAFPGKFYTLMSECAQEPEFREVCPVGKKREDRKEYEELVLRFFAYSARLADFDHDVTPFLNDYLRDMNASCAKQDGNSALRTRKRHFDRMVACVRRCFPHGFRKSEAGRSTPRVRFEAIAVGVHLALEQNPRLRPSSLDWLDSEEFKRLTTTHASNSGPRLRARVEYVRDSL
ncbi:MAG: DUF262 domain-containing protein, partial [Planctomycetes bacterium]|nr:DUF262 domain-containing protein [Planctomycetota bacterium]